MSWYRVARRAVGLSSGEEYPNLEALLESEAGQPHNGYFYAARIVPSVAALIALAVFLPLALTVHSLYLIGVVGLLMLGAGLGVVFNALDKAISPSKKLIRREANKIWSRYGLGTLVGLEPVVSATVGPVVDEAAAIYLKHTRSKRSGDDGQRRAYLALETAMGRMLELAAAPNARAQELEFEAGWALPLLKEMREMDAAMTRYSLVGSLPVDAVANLREARAELSGRVSAMDELEDRQRH